MPLLHARRRFAFALCLVAAQAGPAHAQNADATSQKPPLETIAVKTLRAEADAPKSEQNATPVQLDAVVVKGEKLGRTLNETASSVSVTTGKQIEQYGDESVYDLTRRVGNALADKDGGLSLRGVSSGGASFGSPVISVYVDGVALDQTATNSNAVDAFDVEQVEILRGPQSTSQGRNALAGAVVSTTRDPTPEWEALARTRLADSGSQQFAFAGGGPLAETLGFRLTANRTQSASDVVNVTRNDAKWDQGRDLLLRGKLAYAPSAIAGLKTVLAYTDTRQDVAPGFIFISDADGEAFRRKATDNVDFAGDSRARLLSLKAELPFAGVFTLSSTTGGTKSGSSQFSDYDSTERDGGTFLFEREGNNLSQELRISARNWGNRSGVLGIYASRFGDRFDGEIRNIEVPVSTVVPAPGTDNVIARVDVDYFTDDRGQNTALFGEMDFAFGKGFTLTTGLRYDRESREVETLYVVTRADGFVGGNQTLPPIDLLPALNAAGVVPASGGVQRADGSYSALLPKLGLRWEISKAWTVFATYSEAYRAGGIEVLQGAGENGGGINQFDPEYTRNYELGFRAMPIKKVGLNLNVYYVQWRDQQVSVRDPDDQFNFFTDNAASSALYGTELEANWRPLRGLNLYLSTGYARTEFKEYVNGGVDLSGNEFTRAPRYTGSVGGSYKHRSGVFASASHSVSTGYFVTPENTADQRGDSRRLLDARLGWQGRVVSIYAYGRNLLDQDYETSSFNVIPGTGRNEEGRIVNYGELRRIGAQLEARF